MCCYPFEVYTDNNPLTYILTRAKLNACGLQWVAELANYNFTIKYRSGKKNIDADLLSHIPAEDFQNKMQEESVLISPEDISLIFKNAEEETENLDIRTKCLTLETKGEIGQIKKKENVEGPNGRCRDFTGVPCIFTGETPGKVFM